MARGPGLCIAATEAIPAVAAMKGGVTVQTQISDFGFAVGCDPGGVEDLGFCADGGFADGEFEEALAVGVGDDAAGFAGAVGDVAFGDADEEYDAFEAGVVAPSFDGDGEGAGVRKYSSGSQESQLIADPPFKRRWEPLVVGHMIT